MLRHASILAAVLLFSAACGADQRGTRERDGGTVTIDDAGADAGFRFDAGPLLDAGGPIDPNCGTAAARWVYLVDSSDVLLRFNPEDATMERLGTLSCPTFGSPFSMSVDRDAQAWVLYEDGKIYRVSTTSLNCEATSFEAFQHGFEMFGMGFVSDAAGSREETLFVAGGSSLDLIINSATLGRVESDLTLNTVGELPGWPELTGTGNAELYGFFPDTSPPSIRLIDKASGNTSTSYPMPQLTDSGSGDRAWAFAFWGGRFFVFYKSSDDDSTNVWRLDPSDGSVVELIHDSGYRIVGAGVSTCAPVELI